MNIKIITKPITKKEALKIGREFYKEMVKGVVDIEKRIIALGGEYHMDANVILTNAGSSQNSIWGFNIYPDREGDDWIEYTALINIRPRDKNRSMTVEDKNIRRIMKEIIKELIL